MATRTARPKPYRGGLLDPIRMPATMSGGRATVLGGAVNRGSSYPWAGTIIADTFFVGLLEDEARQKLRKLEQEDGYGRAYWATPGWDIPDNFDDPVDA